MFKTQIVKKQLQGGVLTVFVEFSSKVDTFTEPFQVSSLDELHKKIRGRLEQIETVYATDVPLGEFTPSQKPQIILDEKTIALNKAREMKELVELGVIQETDEIYTSTINEIKGLI